MRQMDCTDIKVLLSGLIDDEIDAETRYTAERHLAECATCRAMLDEAESLNHLLGTGGDESLSDAFVQNVLGRTVHVNERQRVGWVNWFGWLAAAATLALATTVWMMDLQRVSPAKNTPQLARGDAGTRTVQPAVKTAGYMRSSVYDGRPTILPPAIFAGPAVDPNLEVPRDDRGIVAGPVREDAEALDAAAILMEMLADAGNESFATVEEIRQITEYDNLLVRLAAARRRLAPVDRPAVLACESVLLRIQYGPLSQDDVQELREVVWQTALAGQLTSLSERWYTTHRI